MNYFFREAYSKNFTKIGANPLFGIFEGWWIIITSFLIFVTLPVCVFIALFFPIVFSVILLNVVMIFLPKRLKLKKQLYFSLMSISFGVVLNIFLLTLVSSSFYYFISFLISSFTTIIFISKMKFLIKNNRLKLKEKVEESHDSLFFLDHEECSADGVFEVEDLQVSNIPERSFNHNEVTNNEFKRVVSKLNFVDKNNLYYINNLEIPYKREFLKIEFFELQVIKLYLELCNEIDSHLKSRNSSIKKIMKQYLTYQTYYGNILYTLLCISEFTIEDYYYGRSQGVNTSFKILKDQIKGTDSVFILSEMKKYLLSKTEYLPHMPDYLNQKVYNNLSTWHRLGFMYKRLNIKNEYQKYFESMSLSIGSFLKIDQCLDETSNLYISLINFFKKHEITKSKSFLIKIFIKDWKRVYNFKDEDNVKYFFKSIFRISENYVRYNYDYNRTLDTNENENYIRSKCGEILSGDLNSFLENYEFGAIEESTILELNIVNKIKWKSDLKDIFQANKDIIILKEKCNNLCYLNSKNPNLHLIYFELFKRFASVNKSLSCYYYYKYYHSISNSSEIKPMPVSIAKILFKDKPELEKEFKEMLNKVDSDKTEEDVKSLFEIKRKVLRLDKNEVEQADEVHYKMTKTLNEVLQDEDITEKEENQEYSKEKVLEGVLENFFAEDSKKNTQNLDFSEVEQKLISFFKENKFILSENQLLEFAKVNKLFKNAMIKKINQQFYEIYDESLISQNGDRYCILEENQQIIIKYDFKY